MGRITIIAILLIGCSQGSVQEPELSDKERGELWVTLMFVQNDDRYLSIRENRVKFLRWCHKTARLEERDQLIHKFIWECRDFKRRTDPN